MNELVLRDRENITWLFYIDDKNSLCYNKNNQKPEILQTDVSSEFDVCLDYDSNIHLVYQDISGNIIYLSYDYSEWRKFTILNSKSKQRSISCFKLVFTDKLHIFYKLSHNGSEMLVHQYPNGDPSVVDYANTYCISVDPNRKIHIFYMKSALKHRILETGNGQNINIEDDIRDMSAFVDSENRVHVVYVCKSKTYYTISAFYPDTNEKKMLSFGVDNATNLTMFEKNGVIYVQWFERGSVYECISSDGGNTYKKPTNLSNLKSRFSTLLRLRERGMYVDKCAVIKNQNDISYIKNNYYRDSKITAPKTQESAINNSDNSKALNARIAALEKKLASLGESIDKLHKTSNKPEMKPTVAGVNDIGDIDEKNYELFENTNIDELSIAEVKKF